MLFLSAMCRLVEMFQSTELMVGLALLRRVKPSGPRRFVLLSQSLTSLLHFVLSPVSSEDNLDQFSQPRYLFSAMKRFGSSSTCLNSLLI